jgi:hypothetical protein
MTLAKPRVNAKHTRLDRINRALINWESALYNGCYILGAKGSGKSTVAADIALYHFLNGTAQFVIDPLGVGTIDNFLWRVWRFLRDLPPEIPQSYHARFWERITYINVASAQRVVSFPLLYKTGQERSLLEIAERYLNTILLTSPWLQHAQVQGWPPLHYIGSQTAIILAALNYPLTLALDLLRDPEKWQRAGRFAEAVKRYPEALPAVQFFLEEYIPAGQANRRRLLNPYFDKVFVYNLDDNLRAMFGATKPGIDFDDVERKGQTVLIDFRHETDPQLKRFKLLWIFNTIFEYIRLRGRRDTPLGLIIDEMAILCQHVTEGENPLAGLLDEFINGYMRNHHIYFTCCHQSIYQVDEKLRNTLLSLGTYFFGRCAEITEARELGELLWRNDPFRVQQYHKTWGKFDPPPYPYSLRSSAYDRDLWWRYPHFPYYVLDTEPEYMSIENQREEAANLLLDGLGLFEFFLRPSLREGAVSSAVYKVNLASLVQDTATGEFDFLKQDVVAQTRSLLETTVGMPVKTLLAEQDALLTRKQQQQLPRQQPPQDSRLPQGRDASTRHTGNDPLPKEPTPAQQLADQPFIPSQPSHRRRERVS